MATIPTLSELRHRITTDISNLLPMPSITGSVHAKLADALAGLTYGLYCYINNISQQVLPQNATGKYLNNWLDLFNIEQKQAQFAIGTAVTSSSANITLPNNSTLYTDSGLEYTTTQQYNIIAGTDLTIDVQAKDVGSKYNLLLNTLLRSEDYPDLLIVSSEISGGADIETIEQQKSRLIKRIRASCNFGTQTYYVSEALKIVGIDRAWVENQLTDDGVVLLYVASHNRKNPQLTGKVLREAELKLNYNRPISISEIVVHSVSASAVNVTIRTLETTEEEDKIKIEQLISDYIYKNFEVGETVRASEIQFLLDVYEYSVSILHSAKLGAIPYLNNVTWVQTSNA